ncbi:MAG: hypothetical protein PHE73_07520 [Sulfurovaceae bacterium]|nr:hypothetical protein [Sulfurovaceae bacterium]
MFLALWWHWIIFGFILLFIGLIIGTFFILSFAIAAIMIGIIAFFLIFPFTNQFMLWLIFCIILILALNKKSKV